MRTRWLQRWDCSGCLLHQKGTRWCWRLSANLCGKQRHWRLGRSLKSLCLVPGLPIFPGSERCNSNLLTLIFNRGRKVNEKDHWQTGVKCAYPQGRSNICWPCQVGSANHHKQEEIYLHPQGLHGAKGWHKPPCWTRGLPRATPCGLPLPRTFSITSGYVNS